VHPNLRPLRLILLLLIAQPTVAEDHSSRPRSPAELQVLEWKQLDVNQVNCTIASDGPYADDRRTGSAGFEWPKGSGKTAIFTAGIWVVGIHQPTQLLRTAKMEYSTEYQPGPLLEPFNTSTNDDAGPESRADDPRYRLYKIDRADTLATDYIEWPGDLGAPYLDVNRNGQWDQGVDKPEFYGDQQVWTVLNDVNNEKHRVFGATPPMGIEVRALYWAFPASDALDRTMFIRWTIINKSDADYDSLYVGLWSDIDLGNAFDDLPGCDTSLAFGYVYNGDDDDEYAYGYGSPPPALGSVLLRGPVVRGEADDSAMVGNSWRRGFRHLPPSSIITPGKTCCFPQIQDPSDGSPEHASISYDYLKGMMGTVHQPLVRQDGSVSLFWFSGDPVNGTGYLPDNFPIGRFPPSDLRILVNAGPCALARGDTQEVVGACVISQGIDRLQSVSLLKRDVARVRDFYDGGADTTVRVFPYVNLTPSGLPKLSAKVLLTTSNVTRAWASLVPQDSSLAYSLELYDDGLHDDGPAGDGVFGDLPFEIVQTQAPLRVDVTCQTTQGDTRFFSPILGPLPTITRLETVNLRVLADSLNPDGVINQGDVAHIAFDLVNPNGIAIDSVSITPISADEVLVRDSVLVARIPAFATAQSAGLLELVVPDDAPVGCCKKLILSIRERLYNATWKDTLVFDIEQYVYNPLVSVTEHIEGPAQGAFGYRIEDARQLTDHEYRITIPAPDRITLIDYISGDTLLANHWSPADEWGTNMPLTDGFRLTTGTTQRSNGQILGVYEVRGPGGAPVAPSPGQPASDPGRDVFMKANSTDQWSIINAPPAPPSVRYLNSFYPTVPNSRSDHELRFTSGGSEYYLGPSRDSLLAKATGRLSVETWDIGEPGSDAVDDVRLVPRILDANSNGSWDVSADSTTSEPVYTTTVPPYIEPLPDPSPFLFVGRFRIGNITFYRGPAGSFSMPAEGSVLRLVVSRTPATGDVYAFTPMQLLPVQRAGELPAGVELLQNYPNPFNPTTSIRYQLPSASEVKLVVYDLLGREVAVLVDERRDAGVHEVRFDASHLASGVYMYRLQSGAFTQTRTLVVLR
jgi:hypothetical protein